MLSSPCEALCHWQRRACHRRGRRCRRLHRLGNRARVRAADRRRRRGGRRTTGPSRRSRPTAAPSPSGPIRCWRTSSAAMAIAAAASSSRRCATSAGPPIDPTALRPLELLGDANLALGRYERAVERYEALPGSRRSLARVLYKLGLARYRAGRAEAAIDRSSRRSRSIRRWREAHYLLGLVPARPATAGRRAQRRSKTAAPPRAGADRAREALADLYCSDGEHGARRSISSKRWPRSSPRVPIGWSPSASRRRGRPRRCRGADARAARSSGFPTRRRSMRALGHVWLTPRSAAAIAWR